MPDKYFFQLRVKLIYCHFTKAMGFLTIIKVNLFYKVQDHSIMTIVEERKKDRKIQKLTFISKLIILSKSGFSWEMVWKSIRNSCLKIKSQDIFNGLLILLWIVLNEKHYLGQYKMHLVKSD